MKTTLKFLAATLFGFAIPVNGLVLSKRQDPDCDFANVNEGIGPKIDGARWITDCDRPDGLILDPDGQCPGKEKVEAGPDIDCNRYCEVKRRYYYGEEQGYPQKQAKCNKEADTCSWSEQLSVTVTKTWSVDGGFSLPNLGSEGNLGSLFSLGAGYSVSVGTTEGTASTQGVKKSQDWCAYWTFIPIIYESCGTITAYGQLCTGGMTGYPVCSCHTKKDQIIQREDNRCARTPLVGNDGKAMGYSALVLYDCLDPSRLAPKELQDDIYMLDGVRDPNKHF